MKKKQPINFKRDLESLTKKCQNRNYATALYSALCNMRWRHRSINHEMAEEIDKQQLVISQPKDAAMKLRPLVFGCT